MTANTHDDEYLAICEFYQTVWSLIKENDIWVEQVREEPNPYYNVTTGGLCLEMYYGAPLTLWTPWGALRLGGSSAGGGKWQAVQDILTTTFGGYLIRKQGYNEMGEIGEVYALTKWSRGPLPVPAMSKAVVDYDGTKTNWHQHVQRHGVVQSDRLSND